LHRAITNAGFSQNKPGTARVVLQFFAQVRDVDAQVLRLFHRVRPPDFREQLPVRESFSRADNMAEQRVVCLQDAPHARLLVKVKLNADEHRLTLPTFPRKLTAMPSNFDEAFAAVQSLAKDFDAQKDFYLSPKYQEAEVRKEFIDKFLIALGWDVNPAIAFAK